MSLTVHQDFKQVPGWVNIPYFQPNYFSAQNHESFISFSDDLHFFPMVLNETTAISIPRSPFGSIVCRNSSPEKVSVFLNGAVEHLKSMNTNRIELTHPSKIYGSFVPKESLLSFGFKKEFNDINQHLLLNPEWDDSIHTMQKRKLASLKAEGFTFRKMEDSELKTAYQFLTVCRQTQGLQINISWEQLNTLNSSLPGTYECFGVFRDSKISALCICANTSEDVTYYYLPATSPMFRNQSPMVLLISGMVNYYRAKGFKYMDLGISSLRGEPQQTLMLFKERMGAFTTSKPTLSLDL